MQPAPQDPPRSRHVLVVEDDASQRELLGELLVGEGYSVEYAGDGEAGCKAIARQVPDMVLLDLRLPEMDGLALLRWLRARAGAEAVQVVTLSCSPAPRGLDTPFLRKPFEVDELLRLVRRLRP